MIAGGFDKDGGRVHLRWMVRGDLFEVLQIEKLSFEFAWSEEDFLRCLRQRNCEGIVAEWGEEGDDDEPKLLGFVIYQQHRASLNILNLAVRPVYRGFGVGSQMVQKLIRKLSSLHRSRIMLKLRETNLSAQLFFKKQNFRAVRVLRKHYEQNGEDAFVMQYRFAGEAGCDAPSRRGGEPTGHVAGADPDSPGAPR
jgi:[ribosomal protein S18]-alanine N-acetyltransferase